MFLLTIDVIKFRYFILQAHLKAALSNATPKLLKELAILYPINTGRSGEWGRGR
jgi:hypothetical protein